MSVSVSATPKLEVNPLCELADLFSEKIQQVDLLLEQNAYSEVSALPLISSHIIQSGGKRIRPLLTLAAAQLCGYAGGNRDVQMAVCIEFLHTATLLHDDVVDESPLRRGKPTAHTLWGNQMSVLTGDFLFVKLFQLLVEDGALDVLHLFVKTTQKIIEGEVLQIGAKSVLTLDREGYFAIIESKTAVLFGTALELGGLIANASPDKMAALASYAHNIGMAFQLIDDVLDYTADQPVLGKPVGNDFFEGQITLPLIVLIEQLHNQSDVLTRLQQIITNLERDSADLEWVQGLLAHYGVIAYIQSLAMEFSENARGALQAFAEDPLRQILMQLTHFITNRCN